MKRWILRISKAAGALVLIVGALVLFSYLKHVRIWAPTESVEFASADGTVLRGTLIRPEDEGVHPAVVILHGSGAEDIYAFDYISVANAFVKKGLATLVYQKRGVGESEGEFRTARYSDFVKDAIAAVEFLARHENIDAANIGIHAISEGAWFSPEVAQRTGKVAFIVNKVGPPFSWIETVIWEVESDLRAVGVAEPDLQPLLDVTKRRWNYYIEAGKNPELAAGAERDAINAEMRRLEEAVPLSADVLASQLAPYDAEVYARYSANFSYDPTPFLRSIDVPMLYLYGTEDINIPTARAVPYLEAFREEYGKDIDIVIYDGLGHGLVTWKGAFSAGYTPGYLDRIGTWAAEQAVN